MKVAVVGLGYVGLPLYCELSKDFDAVGFDISNARISQLTERIDPTDSISKEDLKTIKMNLSDEPDILDDCQVYIITVPTPVTPSHEPDLGAVCSAAEIVGSRMKAGTIVVLESTVYPGCTRDVVAPILERYSNLKFGKDFQLGYSPERINPGDTVHTVRNITKIISASSPDALKVVEGVYGKIIDAGLHVAPTIEVAEAAKVIENSQRDINVAFVNELAVIFDRLGIDTLDVLQAAGTKWNFLNFRPGLVGGHCIGVDPYYLTFKAKSVGYYPEVILAGRRINDQMGSYIGNNVAKAMAKNGATLLGSKVLVLGCTFKENCPDLRNSKVFELISSLQDFGCSPTVCDPNVTREDVAHYTNSEFLCFENVSEQLSQFDAVVFAVAHSEFVEFKIDGQLKAGALIFDIKGIRPKNEVTWRL